MEKEIYFKRDNRRPSILDKGKDGDFYWVILSLGMHPCSYIGVPKNHKFFGLGYDEIYEKYGYDALDVHGGITYTDPDMYPNPVFLPDVFWVGWDYGHSGDWASYYEEEVLKGTLSYHQKNDHKWTLKELQKEMKKALKKIKEV